MSSESDRTSRSRTEGSTGATGSIRTTDTARSTTATASGAYDRTRDAVAYDTARSAYDTAREEVETTKRLNINLPAKVFADLQQLSQKSGRSMTEIVRTALGLVQIAYDETLKNNKLVVMSSKGKPVKQIVIP